MTVSLTVATQFQTYFTYTPHMSQSVLDLGLQPTKRVLGQAIRRHRNPKDQTNVQTANQIESAKQLRSLSRFSSSPSSKPLGLQEIGLIFDQETKRMWDIDLRQRGLADGTETRDKLSRLYHELFRVNPYRILDRYWRRVGQTISQRVDVRETVRKYFRARIYKRCKEWFESEDPKIYLNNHTESGSAQLQPWETALIPFNTVYSNNDEGVSCARCSIKLQGGRNSGSLPDTVDSGYYEERDSGQKQLGDTLVGPLDTGCLSNDEGVSYAQLQLTRTFERPLHTNYISALRSPTLLHCPFLTPIQNDTGHGHSQHPYVGQDTTFGYDYELMFPS